MYEITGYDHYGRGITKINDKICFVDNTLIGDVVELKITNDKKNYSEAIVTKYIKKNDKHCESVCKYYAVCGGCNILHMPYEEQLSFKHNKITNIIAKYVSKDIKINDIVPSNIQFHYRNKVTLHKKNNIIGYYNKNSNDIIKIDECLLLNDLINKEIKKIDGYHLVIRTNGQDIINDNNQDLLCQIGDYKYNISLNSFYQINDNVTKKLYDKIKEYANLTKKEIVYDLYCGAGTIGIYLANEAKYVYGIEINEEAILNANKNKEINNIHNIEFISGSCSDNILAFKDKPDVIIVDPPRAGLDSNTIKEIINLNPQKIIYTSCDPMTLARDLKILSDKYSIIEITPFDMFPNTYHVECVVLLVKK